VSQPSAMCRCGDHWRYHAASGQTSGGRPCWGWKGQSTPYEWRYCDCPGFRPILLRVGRKVGRTIYAQVGTEPSDDDRLIGVMDTPQLAEEAVRAVNILRVQERR
jgi:hypothetical protein